VLEGSFEIVDLFPSCHQRWPALSSSLGEASRNVAGLAAMVDVWRRTKLSACLPFDDHRRDLAARLTVYAVLTSERLLDLAGGAAADVESDRLFSAATAARGQLELIGHAMKLRADVEDALRQDPVDTDRLDRITRRALFASPRPLGGSGFSGYPEGPGNLIRAASAVFGPAFDEDYNFLSALAHPVGLVIWSGSTAELPPAHVTEAQAELIVKVIRTGPLTIGHHALALLEMVSAAGVVLPEVPSAIGS
jgi:hypothetical protein